MIRDTWRTSWWSLALALAPFVVLALFHWGWSPASYSGDYAQYILHARALVERTGYADIGYLYHPEAADIGPRMYPPGLPLLLAPLVAIGGTHSALLHLFNIACILLFGVLAWHRLRQSLGPAAAACGVAVALLGMEVGLTSITPLSDLPFCAALWLLFVIADAPGTWSNRRTVVVTLLGFALIGTRLAGVAIVPALGVYWLVHRRTLGVRPLVPVLTWGAAGLAGLAIGAIGNPYSNAIATSFDVGARLAGLVRNYRYALLDATLYPFPGDQANEWYHLIVMPLLVIGAVGVFRRLGASFLTCATVAYAALLLTVRVGEARYLWPVIPLLGASLAQGVSSIVGVVRRRVGVRLAFPSRSARTPIEADPTARRAAILVTALVVIGALGRELTLAPPFAVVGTPDAREMYGWFATEQSRAPARAMFHNPRVLTLESGVPAMGLLPRTAPGLVIAMQDRRISHLVWQRAEVSGCLQRIANTIPERFPQHFELAFENATFRVYRRNANAAVVTGEVEQVDWRTPERYCPPARDK